MQEMQIYLDLRALATYLSMRCPAGRRPESGGTLESDIAQVPDDSSHLVTNRLPWGERSELVLPARSKLLFSRFEICY